MSVEVVQSSGLRLRERMARRFDQAMIFLGNRKTAYGLMFGTSEHVPLSAKQFVLDDLKKFCRANRSTFEKDPRMHAVLEGRREVFLRISQHLNMEPEQLYAIANAMPLPTTVGSEDAEA